MNKKYAFVLTSLLFIAALFIGGTGRDDVSLSGYYKFAKDPVFDCVGEVYYKNEFQISCVLIDEKHILTAAHAFYIDSDSLVWDSAYSEEMQRMRYGMRALTQDLGAADLFYIKIAGKKYKVRNIQIHDTYKNAKPIRNDERGLIRNPDFEYDIAVAELVSPVEKVKPAILYEGNDELHKRAIFAGYGWVERADEFNVEEDLHKRRKMGGENMIDSIGGLKVGENYAGLFFDFDGPKPNCCNRLGSEMPLPLEYYPSGGDCGSGLFIKQNDTWQLAAVCASEEYYSEVINYGKKYGKYYGFTCCYQRIFAFKDWISEQVKRSK